VRANVAVYQGKYDNFQAQTIQAAGGIGGLPEAIIVNQDPVTGEANKATLTGGEAELTIIPMRGLEASAFYGYAQGKYDQFIYEPGLGAPSVNLAGQQIDGIAKTTAGLTLNYSPDIPDGLGHPVASAVVYYRSKLSSNSLNPAILGGYTTLDLRIDWRDIGGRPVDVALYGRNVTDRRYATVYNNLESVVGIDSTQLNEPAMFGIEVRYHFGAGR